MPFESLIPQLLQSVRTQFPDLPSNQRRGPDMRGLGFEEGKAALSPGVAGTAATPIHPRFANDGTLEALFNRGGFVLGSAHNGETVARVQQALIDMGFSLPRFGADGGWGGETIAAVRAFQSAAGLGADGLFGQKSMQALNSQAPMNVTPAGAPAAQPAPAGPKQFDWQRLLADQKLEITAGFGYDEGGSHTRAIGEVVAWLMGTGFRRAGQDGRFELFQKRHTFQLQTAKGLESVPADVKVKLVTPGDGAKDAFLDAMANSEVVTYSGHARYGMGMDFDEKDSTKEQVVLGDNSAGHRSGKYGRAYNPHMRDVVKGKENDLERMSKDGKFRDDLYQVMVLNGCSTKNYLDEMRGGLMKGKDTKNLDLIATKDVVSAGTSSDVIISFIGGMLNQRDANTIVKQMGSHESGPNKYFADGLADNPTHL